MMSKPAYSERYEAALSLAARKHLHQKRKGGDVPYIVHLVHVSVIMIRYGYGEDVAVAALLHDIVEDQNYPLAEIEAQFGPEVAGIVAELTEKKRDARGPRPWEIRKDEAVEHARHASLDALAVKAADVLHSTRNLIAALRTRGASAWKSFSRGSGPSLEYYRRIAGVARERMGSHPLAAELSEAVRELEQAIAETEGR